MKLLRNAKGHFISTKPKVEPICRCTPYSPFLWHINRQPSQISLTEPAWKLKLAEQAATALANRRANGTSVEMHLPGSGVLHHGKQVNAYSKAVPK